MRHHRRLNKAFLYASLAFHYLILKTVYHVGRLQDTLRQLIVSVHFYDFRAVDVVDPDIAFCAADYALAVVQTLCSGLQIGHLSVCIAQ